VKAENFMADFCTGPGCWQIMLDFAAATSISNQLDTNEFFDPVSFAGLLPRLNYD
jgi:hypothetical protein